MIYLKQLEDNELKQIKKLYRVSFPKSERKPFRMLLNMRAEGRQELLTVADAQTKKPVGLAFMLTDGKNYILDYLATEPAMRNRGIGAKALAAVIDRYPGKTVVIEIEKPPADTDGTDDASRRKNFYLRCGMKEAGVDIRLFGVEMELLYSGQPVDFDFYLRLLSGAFGEKRNVFLKKNVVLLRENSKNSDTK